MVGMNSDPFDHSSVVAGLPDWALVVIYALPIIVWLIAWLGSGRFSLRGLLVLVAVYACLLAIIPQPFRSDDHGPGDEGWLDEVLKERILY
jgi:hypothetical protein